LAVTPKPVHWIASSRKDLLALPDEVQDVFGYALWLAQQGGKHDAAKPLKGFGGAGVLEVIEDFDGDTYRAIYTVRFEGAVYALDVFQKKSKRGIKTPQADMERVKDRLKMAEGHHRQWRSRQLQSAKGVKS
jgi:phage-related protein